jgi:hypothetical protein
MELTQNKRRAATRPGAWVAAIAVAVAAGLIGWNALTSGSVIHPTNIRTAPATNAYPLLDRNAERQPQGQTSRSGGPGGQIGDSPSD